MLQHIANTLDTLLEGNVELLQKLAAQAKGISNEDLKKLIAASSDPRIQARAALVGTSVNIEFARNLLASAAQEFKILSDLTDPDMAFDAPDETSPETAPDNQGEPLTSEPPVTPETSVTDSNLPPALQSENPEQTVDVQIEGDGVQVVYDDEKNLCIVLPDNSVLTLNEATASTKQMALAKLNRA